MQRKLNIIRRLNAGTAGEIVSQIVRNLLRRKVIRKERLMLRSQIAMMMIMGMEKSTSRIFSE